MDTSRLEMIEQMLKKDPTDDFLVYAAALENRKFGKVDKAIDLLTGLMKRSPDYLGTYYQLGKLLEETGREAEAIETYKAGIPIARAQNDLKASGELGEALMFLEDE